MEILHLHVTIVHFFVIECITKICRWEHSAINDIELMCIPSMFFPFWSEAAYTFNIWNCIYTRSFCFFLNGHKFLRTDLLRICNSLLLSVFIKLCAFQKLLNWSVCVKFVCKLWFVCMYSNYCILFFFSILFPPSRGEFLMQYFWVLFILRISDVVFKDKYLIFLIQFVPSCVLNWKIKK